MSVVLFWSDPDVEGSYEEWRQRPLRFSEFHKLTFASHRKYGTNPILYTYQFVEEAPRGVEVRDANKYLPAKLAWGALRRGHSIAHISDAVRLYAAADCEGIVMDMDAVVIKPLPDDEVFFCSMPAKATGGMAPKWGKSHPPLTVHDASWDGKALSAFPCKVNGFCYIPMYKLAEHIITMLTQSVERTSKGWNFVMWELKRILASNKSYKAFPPIATCPLPAWLGAGKCYSLESPTRLDGTNELFGYPLPSIEDIEQNTFVIQHFFESAFQDAPLKTSAFWHNVPDGSLVAKEAEWILGENWRNQLL